MPPLPDDALTFRQLTIDDVPLLHAWLHRPHVAEWWGGQDTLEEVREYCAELIQPDSRDRGFIVLDGGTPIGYIQSYVVMNGAASADVGSPRDPTSQRWLVGPRSGSDAASSKEARWWPDERDPGARGIDQFIADDTRLGRGLGTAMVRAFVDRLFEDPAVTTVQVDPDPSNARAIRCYEKAGFKRVREVVTPDGPALLMVRTR